MNYYQKMYTHKKIIKTKYLKPYNFKYFKFIAQPTYPLPLHQVRQI